jgi:hypothetical protein
MNFDYVILVDSFKPKNNSAAVMIDELALHMSNENKICVITEDSSQKSSYSLEKFNENYFVLKIRTFKRLRSNSLRGISELINPHIMILIFKIYGLNKKIISKKLIWYSPSIFYSPFIRFYKNYNNAKTYLILRDLFPLWMVDLGLLKKDSYVHKFLNYFEKKQYDLANSIGVQIDSNIPIVRKIVDHDCSISVLNNWKSINTIERQRTLNNKMRAVYAGNIGIAQGPENFDRIIELSVNNFEIKFFSEDTYYEDLKIKYKEQNNIIFSETVANKDLEKEYLNYDFGLVLLDINHKTNNVPGKFISYISNGLPVFCILNKGNPLIEIINNNMLGVALASDDIAAIRNNLVNFIKLIQKYNLSKNCLEYAHKHYDISSIAKQIRESF